MSGKRWMISIVYRGEVLIHGFFESFISVATNVIGMGRGILAPSIVRFREQSPYSQCSLKSVPDASHYSSLAIKFDSFLLQ